MTAVIAGTLLALPLPGAPIPTAPDRLAPRVVATTAALNRAIDRWGGRGRPPRDVTLLALHQQRMVRLLASNERVARRVLPRVGRDVRDDVLALRSLRRLVTPQPLSRIRTRRPASPQALRRYYAEAQRRFGVGWHVLAALNYVESAFGKLGNASVAGAQGPMQFLPATWRAYGLGGDVNDPRDAILGAANYLRASGAPRNYPRALYAYNRSRLYVGAVLRYAARIRRDPRAFLVYYSRQVFIVTPAGDRRVTGPRR